MEFLKKLTEPRTTGPPRPPRLGSNLLPPTAESPGARVACSVGIEFRLIMFHHNRTGLELQKIPVWLRYDRFAGALLERHFVGQTKDEGHCDW